jgi:hypothetical protein
VPLIEPFRIPEKGIWSTVGLGRWQFLGIIAFSVLVFLFLDGAAWDSLQRAHTVRIATSYLVIPVLVAGAQWYNLTLHVRSWLEASVLIALIKLLVTALLFVGLAMFT